MSRFYDRLQARWNEGKFVCVGLDPDVEKMLWAGMPEDIKPSWVESPEFIEDYLKKIIDATHDLVCAYKPNWAFFLRYGVAGLALLENIIEYIRTSYLDVVLILDAKVGDIGNTNMGYVDYFYGDLDVDAVTVHPYMGATSLLPFLADPDQGVIVLVRTSNPGAGELQDQDVWLNEQQGAELDLRASHGVRTTTHADGTTTLSAIPFSGRMKLYEYHARRVGKIWNTNRNCAVVVGATVPDELKRVRGLVGDDLPILIPGVGAQGGDLATAARMGQNSRGQGIIINASRSVLYAAAPGEDIGEAARAEVERMNAVLRETLFQLPEGNDT